LLIQIQVKKPHSFSVKNVVFYLGITPTSTFVPAAVGHSAASPRQVPLSLHLPVGFTLHSLMRGTDLRIMISDLQKNP
jgi:hypothetical protein